jgi:hypothetical protein
MHHENRTMPAHVRSVQPPRDLYVSSMVGNVVTFRWTPARLGPAATGFVIEGGLNPADVLATLPTASPYPIFAVTVPTGSFHVRVHALAADERR